MNSTQIAKLSAIANRLLELALEVESGTTYVGSDVLIKMSHDISSAINPSTYVHEYCWDHLKGMTGNLSPPPSPKCNAKCDKKVSFKLLE